MTAFWVLTATRFLFNQWDPKNEDGEDWNGPFTTQVSFRLLGDDAIPEPSPSVLVAISILALVWARQLFFRKIP
jgi:hypothetical protein